MADSFYRISSANMYDSAIQNLGARQKTLADLQENLTSGKRVVRPSDDPVAAAQAERAMTRISRIQAEQRQLGIQKDNVAQAESTLGNAVDVVQQIRELVVASGNGSLTQADRQTNAMQIQSLQDQLKDIINSKDTNGVPLLGSLGSALAPFVGPNAAAPDYLFSGLPGQTASQSTSIASQLDGQAAVMFDPVRDGVYTATLTRGSPTSSLNSSAVTTSNLQTLDGATYALTVSGVTTSGNTTSVNYSYTKTARDGTVTGPFAGSTTPVVTGQPMPVEIKEGPDTVVQFTLQGTPAAGDTVTVAPSTSLMGSIQSAISGIQNAPDSIMAAQTVNSALAGIDAGLQRLSTVRSYAGQLLNRADSISKDQDSRSVQLQSDRSNAEDLDMVKGISDFQNAQVGYQAALQSYASIQKLSLFNYMS